MADDNNNDEEKQRRRLVAKREYNRVLSATKRQRNKDDITSLAAQVEFQADRASKFEKKNAELLQQIKVLTAEQQRLQERIQQLTTSSSTLNGGVGLVHGPTTTAQSSSIGGQPDLAIATFGATAGSPLRAVDQRYNLHLAAGLLPGTARSSNGGGSGGVGRPMLASSSYGSTLAPPRQQPLLLDQLSSSLYQNDTNLLAQRSLNTQELDLLIRLNSSARNNTNTNTLSNSVLMMSGAPSPRGIAFPASAVAASDVSLLARLLATAGQASPSNSRLSIPASSADTIQRAPDQQVQLRQSSSSSSSNLAGAQYVPVGLQQQRDISNRRGEGVSSSTLGGEIEGREQQQQHQLMIMSLLERIMNQRGG